MRNAFFLLFLLFSFLSFANDKGLRNIIRLNKSVPKVVSYPKTIKDCFIVYNKVEVECQIGGNSITFRAKDNVPYEKVLVLFEDNTRLSLRVEREERLIVKKVKSQFSKIKKNREYFSLKYSQTNSYLFNRNDLRTQQRLLTLSNRYNKLLYSITLMDNETIFDGNNKFYFKNFALLLKYKKMTMRYGILSSLPLFGVQNLAGNIFGLDFLYKERNWFLNFKRGKEGNIIRLSDNYLNTASFGFKLFDGMRPTISYGRNENENISISGVKTGFRLGDHIAGNLEVSNSRDDEVNLQNYRFSLSKSHNFKNSFFEWKRTSFNTLLNPDGTLILNGGRSDTKSEFYGLSNGFNLNIPEKYGKLSYTNSLNYIDINDGFNTNFSNQNVLTYNKKLLSYSLGYTENYLQNNELSSTVSNNVVYKTNNTNKHNFFGLSFVSQNIQEVRTDNAGFVFGIKRELFDWKNSLITNYVQREEENSQSYIIRSSLNFKEALSLDKLGLNFQSFFREDQLGELYNSLNQLSFNLGKSFNNNHSLSFRGFYGINNTYVGKRDFKGFTVNYNFNWGKEHNTVSNLIFKKNKTLYFYKDKNLDNNKKGDPIFNEKRTIVLHDQDGDVLKEKVIKNGSVNFELDSRIKYNITLKNTKEDKDRYKINSNELSINGSNVFLIQEYVNNYVNIYDIFNNKRVDTAELKVFCDNGYRRTYSPNYMYKEYYIQYPLDVDCYLDVGSSISETYHNLVYQDVLPKKSFTNIKVTLERYNKVYGFLKDEETKKPFKNKLLIIEGKKVKTDEYGYFEAIINNQVIKVGGAGVIKSKFLKNHCSLVTPIYFSRSYIQEKEIKFRCNKKNKKK